MNYIEKYKQLQNNHLALSSNNPYPAYKAHETKQNLNEKSKL